MTTTTTETTPASTPASNIIPIGKWGRDIGKTAATIWRWRKQGKIVVLNISGRNYLTLAEIARFEARVAAGEFSKAPKMPSANTETAE